MLKIKPLPYPRVTTEFENGLFCPFCGVPADDACVRLGDLVWLFIDKFQPTVLGADHTPIGDLLCDCFNCFRPFSVRMEEIGAARRVRLVPVRTDADLRFVGEGQ